MKKIENIDKFYIVMIILFAYLSIFSIYSHINNMKTGLSASIKEWDKGLDILINDLKKSTHIEEFNSQFLIVKRFNTPPTVNNNRPDANIDFIESEYFLKDNTVFRKNSQGETSLLKNVTLFNISLINKNTEIILEDTRENAAGFKIFILFKHDEKEIPVEFTIFSEYLTNKVNYKHHFDFIDDKEFF